MKLMITNGGVHPADKWADVTAESILDLIQIGADSTTPEAFAARQAKRDLSPKLFAILHKHHDDVQVQHRGALKKLKASQLDQPIDVTPHLGTVQEVLALLATTPFAAHFAQPHVQDVITQTIGRHTANVIHIERSAHTDALSSKQGT